MTVRQWKNIVWSLFIVSLYATIINFLNLKDIGFYIAIALGVSISIVLLHIILHSSDKRIVVDYITKEKEQISDIFEINNYVLLEETSDKRLTQVSDLVLENFGEEDIKGILDYLEKWKTDNKFIWDCSTLYDKLKVEGVVENKKLNYVVKHIKSTKTFKLFGKLIKVDEIKVEDKYNFRTYSVYEINGIRFVLTNVFPNDIDKSIMWEISLYDRNERNQKNQRNERYEKYEGNDEYEDIPYYYGVIVSRIESEPLTTTESASTTKADTKKGRKSTKKIVEVSE